MDGTLRETLVQDNIQWPTGLCGGDGGWGAGRGRGPCAKASPKLGGTAPTGGQAGGRGSFSEGAMGGGGGTGRSGAHTGPFCFSPSGAESRASRLCLPGLAVDYHNERLYWADAKLSVIGSIRLNGTDPIVAADSKRGACLTAALATLTPGLPPPR